MSFTPEISNAMVRYNPIPVLADILGEAAKEKVTRIVLATFRVRSFVICFFVWLIISRGLIFFRKLFVVSTCFPHCSFKTERQAGKV